MIAPVPTPEAPPPPVPGVIITQPEDLPQHERVPYDKHDRVVSDDTLRLLELEAARFCDVETGRLVMVKGDICEHGSVMLLELYDRPFGVVESHLVASYDARRGRPRFAPLWSRGAAESNYGRAFEALGGSDVPA